MCGAVPPPFRNTPSWRGAQLKNGQGNFTLRYLTMFDAYFCHESAIQREDEKKNILNTVFAFRSCLNVTLKHKTPINSNGQRN